MELMGTKMEVEAVGVEPTSGSAAYRRDLRALCSHNFRRRHNCTWSVRYIWYLGPKTYLTKLAQTSSWLVLVCFNVSSGYLAPLYPSRRLFVSGLWRIRPRRGEEQPGACCRWLLFFSGGIYVGTRIHGSLYLSAVPPSKPLRPRVEERRQDPVEPRGGSESPGPVGWKIRPMTYFSK